MVKLENQTMLVTALRAFTGKLPPGYATEKEFFLTSLLNMEEYLGVLQAETLKEVCAVFLRKLEAGKAAQREIDDLKAAVDHLVSDADFKLVCAGMAGSAAFIRQRLAGLKPVSMLGEARKGPGMDSGTERRIESAYARLNFPALVKQAAAAPSDASANAALAKAREEVAEYCLLYRIQVNAGDTLTPFSMSYVDAALAASYLLYKDLSKATGRAL